MANNDQDQSLDPGGEALLAVAVERLLRSGGQAAAILAAVERLLQSGGPAVELETQMRQRHHFAL